MPDESGISRSPIWVRGGRLYRREWHDNELVDHQIHSVIRQLILGIAKGHNFFLLAYC